jgi:hypothetical protein
VKWLSFIVLVFAAGAGAATLEPEPPALGERGLLRLEVAPADSTEWPVGLNAAVHPTDDPREFGLVPLRVGTVGVLLPATGDTLTFEVPTSIEEVRPEYLRPIHSVGALGPRWGGTILLAALVLGLLLAAAVWWIARRRRLAPVPEVPPEPAEVVALRELAILEADGLVVDGRFEEFYVRGSHILREYAGRRFALPILDYTTTETLEAMRAHALADRFAGTVAPLLSAADEVKFARHQPDQSDGDSWLREARGFVNASTPVAEPEQTVDDDAEPGGRAAEVSV